MLFAAVDYDKLCCGSKLDGWIEEPNGISAAAVAEMVIPPEESFAFRCSSSILQIDSLSSSYSNRYYTRTQLKRQVSADLCGLCTDDDDVDDVVVDAADESQAVAIHLNNRQELCITMSPILLL